MKKLKVLFIVFTILVSGIPSQAQNANGVSMVNSIYDYWYDLNQVAVSGDFACVASGRQGVRIVDISDPNSPRQVSVVDIDGAVRGVAAGGEYAYAITAEPTTLQVIDKSDPNAPEVISSLELQGSGWELEICGDLVIIAAGKISHGVNDNTPATLIVDVSNPRNPFLLEGIDIRDGYARTISVNENYVFSTDFRHQQITAINISDQDSIIQVNRHQMHVQPRDISVTESHGCIVAGTSRLFVYDVSEPENRIFEAGSIYFEERVHKVEMDENFAYCLGSYYDRNEGWLYVVNLEDPSEPELIDEVLFDFPVKDLSLEGDIVYVSTIYDGMLLLDISDPSEVLPLSSIGEYGKIDNIFIENDMAFVADSMNGLIVLDISDPIHPQELTRYETPGQATSVYVTNNLVYISDGEWGMHILDISDVEGIREISSLRMDGYAHDIEVSGDYAYLACGQDFWNPVGEGLWIIDISDIDNLQVAGRLRIPCSALAISGDYAFVTGFKMGLWTINVSNPQDPVIVNGIFTEGLGSDIKVRDESLFWADGDVLWQYDISDPRQMILRREYRTGICLGADVSREFLFAADWYGGMVVFDMSDEEDQNVCGNISEMNVYPGGIAVTGQYAYVAGHSGIAIMDCSEAMGIPAAPYWDDIPDYVEANAGETIEFTVIAIDVNGDDIWLGVNEEELPDGAEFTDNGDGTGYFRWETGEQNIGEYSLTFSAGDNEQETSAEVVIRIFDPESVDNDLLGSELTFRIEGNYPNPFNAETTIVYNLPRSENVSLQVFDLHGRVVANLHDGILSSGVHKKTWNASNNAGGIYLVRFASKTKTDTQRILLVK